MKNLIDGKSLDSSDGKTIEIINPANGDFIDTIPDSTVEDVDKAVKVAQKAQKEWEKVPVYERGRILEKYVQMVESRKEELSRLLSNETGKPITEARNEMGNVRILTMGFVEKAKHLYGKTIPVGTEPGSEKTIQYTVREPLGVVATIIPFNFPVDLFGQKIPSALMAGNSVIIKPSTYNPLTLITLTHILMEAGVPAGVAQVINGAGPVVGQALAGHPGVHLISLTGSTAAGIQTMGTASKNLTHVTLELGGNDAFILLEDGDIDLAVEETIWGRMYNAGQVCCASKRFLIQNTVKDTFIEKLQARLAKMKVGLPEKEDTQMGCLINVNAAKRVEEQVNEMVSLGASIVCGGKRTGAFYTPTILNHVTPDMPVAKDMEIFGPVVSIIGFDTEEEAITIANQSQFGLCGCVFSQDMSRALRVANALECGGSVINGASFWRSTEMPFGGWKKSGIGNEGVMTTLEEMTRIKTIVLKNVIQ